MDKEVRYEDGVYKTERTKKGNSLITFPEDYVVVDLETTGLSPEYDNILEVCALKVRDNKISDVFSSLVNSGPYVYIDEFITSLTGITREMIDNAPKIKDVFPGFLDFIGSDIVMGHNVNFDVNFIYDESIRLMGKPFSNNFVDTMRISRRLHSEERHHRLSDLTQRYSIDSNGVHRAQKDCEITKTCYDILSSEVLQKYGGYDKFIDHLSHATRGIHAKDISTDNQFFDEGHILYGKVCVFTGALDKMTRKEAMQIVADLGGINADSVTKKTNYLILGCNDYRKNIKDGKSNKQKKAEKLQLNGQDITVISEDVFYDMVGMN